MTRRNLKPSIIAYSQQGKSGAWIARKLDCSTAYVSQVLSFAGVLLPAQAGMVQRHQPKKPADTCQRPDARKNFDTCGEPKMRTACGEMLGVCRHHYETTKPLGGTKL